MGKGLIFLFSLIVMSQSSWAVPPSTPELIQKGKAAYAVNCIVCHGGSGDGNGMAGAAMNPKPRDFIAGKYKKGSTPENIFNTITHGLDGTAMAGFPSLSETDRWGLTYYILTFKK
jgi:mono/diheme cytochrome c family protein